jgi:broad specificity phosphatase PhoE
VTPFLILRHATTAWNAERRIQGTIDTPLAPEGVAEVKSWRLPSETASWRAVSSPRRRALETAAELGLAPVVEPRLTEMNWGAWEGRRFDELRQSGELTDEAETLGLDFRPPGGESPRDVQARLTDWLAGIASHGAPLVAVSHHGVLRALYALASGWDMTGVPPVKLRNGHAHRFAATGQGGVTIIELNIPLGLS